jgi:hypothetical protein
VLRSLGSLRLLGSLSQPPRELREEANFLLGRKFGGERTGVLHELRSFS